MNVRKYALSLVFGLLLTLGLIFGLADPAAARSRQPLGHDGATCLYAGVEYSEGSIIVMDDGNRYKCEDGKWEYYASGSENVFQIQPYPLPKPSTQISIPVRSNLQVMPQAAPLQWGANQ